MKNHIYCKTCPYRNASGTKFYSGFDRVFAFVEEQRTMTCTIDIRVIIQDVSSVGLQMVGELLCKYIDIIKDTIF